MIKDYIWERASEEICSAIDLAIKQNEVILFWQSINEEKKLIRGAILIKEPIVGNLIIGCENQLDLNKLNPKYDIYVKLKNRATVFKSKITNIAKKNFEIEMPKEVKAIELRKNSRSSIENESFALVEKMDSNSLGKMQFSFGVVNESKKGLGLTLSVSKMNLFQIGEIVKIIKFKGKYLTQPIECRIIHITKNTSENINLKNVCKFGVEIINGEA